MPQSLLYIRCLFPKYAALQFPPRYDLRSLVKSFPGTIWDPDLESWLLPDYFIQEFLAGLYKIALVNVPEEGSCPSVTVKDQIDGYLFNLDSLLEARHYARRTQRAYHTWLERFLLSQRRHLSELSADNINQFLTQLAVKDKVSASTQNQAFAAIVFFFREILDEKDLLIDNLVRARRSHYLPTVLSKKEVSQIISHLEGTYKLLISLMYGSGMRLNEAISLRVQDLDFSHKQIIVHQGKGHKDRRTTLAPSLIEPLKHHLAIVHAQHKKDIEEGFGNVPLPDALEKKYPNGSRDWNWQWVFPQSKRWLDPVTGAQGRYHIDPSILQRALKLAIAKTDILKRVSCHTFRHSYATHLIESGYDIRTVQELLGHTDVKTTMIYTHVLNRGPHGVKSPFEDL